MISVEGLTRTYGSFVAVDDVTSESHGINTRGEEDDDPEEDT